MSLCTPLHGQVVMQGLAFRQGFDARMHEINQSKARLQRIPNP